MKVRHFLPVLSWTQVSAAAANKSNEKVTVLRMALPAPSPLQPASVQKGVVKVALGWFKALEVEMRLSCRPYSVASR